MNLFRRVLGAPKPEVDESPPAPVPYPNVAADTERGEDEGAAGDPDRPVIAGGMPNPEAPDTGVDDATAADAPDPAALDPQGRMKVKMPWDTDAENPDGAGHTGDAHDRYANIEVSHAPPGDDSPNVLRTALGGAAEDEPSTLVDLGDSASNPGPLATEVEVDAVEDAVDLEEPDL